MLQRLLVRVSKAREADCTNGGERICKSGGVRGQILQSVTTILEDFKSPSNCPEESILTVFDIFDLTRWNWKVVDSRSNRIWEPSWVALAELKLGGNENTIIYFLTIVNSPTTTVLTYETIYASLAHWVAQEREWCRWAVISSFNLLFGWKNSLLSFSCWSEQDTKAYPNFKDNCFICCCMFMNMTSTCVVVILERASAHL